MVNIRWYLSACQKNDQIILCLCKVYLNPERSFMKLYDLALNVTSAQYIGFFTFWIF